MTTENNRQIKIITGIPTERQKEFFSSEAKYTAYGGARGGGKSWALRRKLIAMCLRYKGIRCLLVRRSLGELKANHVLPLLKEYGELVSYSASDMSLSVYGGSRIDLGYCDSDRDVLRYQGLEYDVIAIDEATQMSEDIFSIFKACLRGANHFPKRIYLTCNPGGVGHSWVKRLFVDRKFRLGEDPNDYRFIPALVFDNTALMSLDPDYVKNLESLPPRLRDAWLYGCWDVFEGQFFSEFDTSVHVCLPSSLPKDLKHFAAMDYGFDMLAVLIFGIDSSGRIYVTDELCRPGLTLGEAASCVASLCHGRSIEFISSSPDLWNRRQDSGKSGFEIMQVYPSMPPMIPADNRRIPGWRMVKEYLAVQNGTARLVISSDCKELIRCIPALLHDKDRPEDASSDPHEVTHAPEALRYGIMSRCPPPSFNERTEFRFRKNSTSAFFD